MITEWFLIDESVSYRIAETWQLRNTGAVECQSEETFAPGSSVTSSNSLVTSHVTSQFAVLFELIVS